MLWAWPLWLSIWFLLSEEEELFCNLISKQAMFSWSERKLPFLELCRAGGITSISKKLCCRMAMWPGSGFIVSV